MATRHDRENERREQRAAASAPPTAGPAIDPRLFAAPMRASPRARSCGGRDVRDVRAGRRCRGRHQRCLRHPREDHRKPREHRGEPALQRERKTRREQTAADHIADLAGDEHATATEAVGRASPQRARDEEHHRGRRDDRADLNLLQADLATDARQHREHRALAQRLCGEAAAQEQIDASHRRHGVRWLGEGHRVLRPRS